MKRTPQQSSRDTRAVRTLRGISDNLRPGQAIQAADQIFKIFEPHLREYFLNSGEPDANRTVDPATE